MSKEQTAEEILYKHYKKWIKEKELFMIEPSIDVLKGTGTYPIGIAAMEEYVTLKLQEQAKEIERLKGERDRLNDFVSLTLNSYKLLNDKTDEMAVLRILINRADQLTNH